MKVFRNLELEGGKSALLQVIEDIEKRLEAGWAREHEKERKIATDAPDAMYCFSCSDDKERETAELWLAHRGENALYVANIIPDRARQLTIDQYNAIAEEFYEKYARPAAEALGLNHLLTPSVKEIEDWVSEETAAKLRRFSRLANKQTGSTHFLDEQRWLDFLVSAHAEVSTLDSGTLIRWLVENEGWPEDIAYNLAVEYEFARSLLAFYDEHK